MKNKQKKIRIMIELLMFQEAKDFIKNLIKRNSE